MDTKKNTVSTDLLESSPQKPKFFSLNIQNWKKHTFSKKIRLTMFLWTQRKLFRPIYWKFFYKIRQIFAQCPQVMKFFFLQTCCFNKVFFWTRGKQFWQTSWNFFDNCRKSSAHWPTMIKYDIFFRREQFSSQCSYGNVECAFDNSIDFLNN